MTRRLLAHTAFAVLVITGWLLALVWLSLSVSQIAVERTVVKPCTMSHPNSQGETCWD